MKLNRTIIPAAILSAGIILGGCQASNTQKGTAIGAGAGGAIGGVIGNQAGNTALGAIIGATVGGTTGAIIGSHMDKQAEELERDLEGATVERVGEGIKITFDSGLLFAIDSDDLSSASQTNIANLANTLKKYEDTDILVYGHTDASGSDDYNQALSERRAESVENYLEAKGVSGGRITAKGFGESEPVASNDTAAGRQQNRRVEVAIMANKRMKRAGREGKALNNSIFKQKAIL